MAEQTPTDEEILAQLPAARARAREAAEAEPRAVDAWYEAGDRLLVVELRNGCRLGFPPELVRGLGGATAEQLAGVEVEPGGEGLHWEALDADVSLPGLIARALGVQRWAAKYLGQATSEAKARAARENGRKGGRPRKGSAEGSPTLTRRASGTRVLREKPAPPGEEPERE